MIKPWVYFLILSFSIGPQAFGEECVNCIVSELVTVTVIEKICKDLNTIVNFDITEESAEDFLKLSSSYLKQIKSTNNFQADVAFAHKKHLKEIADNPKITSKVRARAQLICSGIVGRLADKNQSASMGKESFEMVKKAMRIDPTYEDAKTSYITAINELSKRNFVVRKVIESSLDIVLDKEVKSAIRMIEKEGWQEDKVIKPMYLSLKKF
jgi:hypothetical protein